MTLKSEKVMYWWAKISSFIVFYFIFYVIYMTFEITKTYLNLQETRLQLASLGSYSANLFSFGDLITLLFVTGISTIFGLIFYSPLLYYGWVKHPNNKNMKGMAKVISIFWIGIVIYSTYLFIVAESIKFTDILGFSGILAFAVPMYYFGWRV